MKISKLSKFAWAFFVLALGNAPAFSQGYKYQNNRNISQQFPCLTRISDLTSEQKIRILELDENHQKVMDELRTERRSVYDFERKNEIREKMQKVKEVHQSDVKNVLTQNQQREYDLIRSNTAGSKRGQLYSKGNNGNCNGKQKGFQQQKGCRKNQQFNRNYKHRNGNRNNSNS